MPPTDPFVQAADAPLPGRLARLSMAILWPAFLMAGVLVALTFAVVDPAELHWFGGAAIGWPAAAVHSVTFLMFWGAIATAGAMSALLLTESDAARPPDEADAGPVGAHPAAAAADDAVHDGRSPAP